MILELSVVLASVCAPQQAAADEWFELHQTTDGVVVSAHRRGASAEDALRRLSKRMNWRFELASPAVAESLQQVTLDLAFKQQKPRTVAAMIAAAADMSVTFDKSGHRIQVRVVAVGGGDDARSELQKQAIEVYRHALADRDTQGVAKAKRAELMLQLGDLLAETGELVAAGRTFEQVFESTDSRSHAATALLRASVVYREIATGVATSELQRESNLRRAEESARRLIRMKPTLEMQAAGTLLLGRILRQAGHFAKCTEFLEDASLTLGSVRETTEVHLILADCYRLSGQPQRAVDTLTRAERVRATERWLPRNWVDYYFVHGMAAESLGREAGDKQTRLGHFIEAMQSLEVYLARDSEQRERRGAKDVTVGMTATARLERVQLDKRHRRALIVLSGVYLDTGKYLQARSAIDKALRKKQELTLTWLQRAHILRARIQIGVGEREAALERLEMLARPRPEELSKTVLFLVDSRIEGGDYDRAITAADLLAGGEGRMADEARFRKILAMFQRAKTQDALAGFPESAIEVARMIRTKSIQSKAAETIGDAYEALGMIDRAVEAYRGILR